MLVKTELLRLNLRYTYLELGEVHLTSPISESKRKLLRDRLKLSGLVLMDDKKAILIAKIKRTIVEMIHIHDELPDVKYSVYLSSMIQKDYHSISELFSKTTGMTIEHFIILHKIEKAKELIMYNELNFTEIAFKLHYSSVAHLSHQFKKITGLTPTFFKGLQLQQRTNLEDI
jgi:YesN/AraC family two-component response regulator